MEKDDKAISHFCLQLGRKAVEDYLKRLDNDNDKQFLGTANFESPVEASKDCESSIIAQLLIRNSKLEVEILSLKSSIKYWESQGKLFDVIVQGNKQTIKNLRAELETVLAPKGGQVK